MTKPYLAMRGVTALLLLLGALCALHVAARGVDTPLLTLLGVGHIVAFSPDGEALAAGGQGEGIGVIRVVDVSSGQLIQTLTGHPSAITGVAFSGDGRFLATCSNQDEAYPLHSSESTVRVWDASSWELLRKFQWPSATSIAFSPTENLLAVGSFDEVRFYNPSTGGEYIRRLEDEDSHIGYSFSFSPDGSLLATMGRLGMIKLWNVSSGVLAGFLPAHGGGECVAFSPDGEKLASGSSDNMIKLCDVSSGVLIRTLTGHTGTVHSVVFSPDGRILASGSSDGTVKLWSVPGGEPIYTFTSDSAGVTSLAFSCDGGILAAGEYHGTIRLWDVDAILYPNDPPSASFTWQALMPDGTWMISEPHTGDQIEFDASASSDPDGEIVEYAWDWDNNGSYDSATTDPVIEHSFTVSGTHRVTLRATDDAGATDTATETVTIRKSQSPNASFRFAPSSPSILDTVRFTDASADEDGDITAWHWDFGDGAASAEQHPTHKYATTGSFTVTLIVTDDDGLTGVAEMTLTVVNLLPSALFTWGIVAEDGARLVVEPRTGDRIAFDASSSSDPDGEIVEYAWDWTSDGT